jgi:phosphinothricin acetyltransferase
MNPNDDTGTGAEAGDIVIRDVTDGDMEAVREIYSHHVLEGLASFEDDPPDAAEMTRRRDALLEEGYPYRVAVQDGRVKGYAYVSSYRPRPAYRHTVENSVYVDVNTHRQGIGRRLLQDLIEKCTAMGYRQMVAVIGDTANQPSIGLHAQQGFEVVGTLPSVGYKFGRWVGSVIMQRPLGDGDDILPDG